MYAQPLNLEQKRHLNHFKQELQSIPEILIGHNTLHKCCQNNNKIQTDGYHVHLLEANTTLPRIKSS